VVSPVRTRWLCRRRLAPLLVAVGTSLCAPAGALAADEPDLVPELRQDPYPGQVAPVYVDAFEEPGRLLYRFDALLRNQGGTLDLYRDPATGKAMQAVWSGGEPSETPDPNQPPTSSDATPIDLAAGGATFAYVFEKSHEHWHFFSAARYELELPDGASRVSDKIGFCLFDGFDGAGGATLYFPPGYTGGGTQTWCGFDHPDGDFVRMGLSPGAADRYASQREFQWIDIAGLRPGGYTLRATANPDRSIVESDPLDNVVREPRLIPGVLAAGVTVRRTGRSPLAIGLSGEVVAPWIPARRAAGCDPVATSEDCYVRASATGPLSFRIVRAPRHGTATIAAQEGLHATALYAPEEGHPGPDSFEYTATDARGLESPPAVVEVQGPTVSGKAQPGAEGAQPVPRRLLAGLAVRRRGDRWYAIVRLTAGARVRGRLERRGSPFRLVRRIRHRRLPSGRHRVALGRLRAGSYRLRLRFSTGTGRQSAAGRRFRVVDGAGGERR
jgi:Lysyl oxidase/Bacterial Ig domain